MCLWFACFGLHRHDDDYYLIPPPEKIEIAIRWMEEEISKSISVLLELEGPRRVTDDRVRHCLTFMKTELSAMIASLQSSTNLQQLWPSMWLRQLKYSSLWVSRVYVMHHDDPVRPTLLLRAAHSCGCSRLTYQRSYNYNDITDGVVRSYKFFQVPYRYKLESHHHCSFNLGRPPHEVVETEATGLHLVGVDGPAKKLFAWIMATDNKLRLISIVGTAGMGKTTLAMELHRCLQGGYNNFQCCAIAQVCRVPDVKKLLQHILSQVLGSPAPPPLQSEMATLDKEEGQAVLIRRISEQLEDKRYFILLDDIWNISDWEKIMDAFPKNNCGSRILVTTCLTSIARSCHFSDYVHEMEPLNNLDSERLLLTKAFNLDANLPGNVKLICGEILRRCEGIPLFITGMADWLKKELQLWPQQEMRNQCFTLHSVEQVPKLLKQFKQALSPTYNDLPYKLKLLLLYMISMFPQGYQFGKDRLIMKWLLHEELTHSLDIKDKDEEEMEDYFSELVDRNIITPVLANWRNNVNTDESEVWQWKISHYMWQFLSAISAEKGFAFTCCTLTSTTAAEAGGGYETRASRRLALHHPNLMLPAQLQTMDLSQTRSLVVSGAVDIIPLNKFLYLVVLDLEGWKNLNDDNMLEICSSKMYLLLHLSIRNTPVSRLPTEIQELCSLRTLDVSHTQIAELPTQIKKLSSLRNLDVSHTQITELPAEIKELCSLRTLDVSHTQIDNLPSEVYMLENLWRLDLRSTLISQLLQQEHVTRNLRHILVGDGEMAVKIPERIQRSDNLKTLATIDLSEHPASLVKALGDLVHLRVIAITWSFHQCTDEDYCEALRSSITKWSKLKSLTIQCGFSCNMDFLATLPPDPPKLLEKFKVTAGRFARVPEWIATLKCLLYVQITVCRLVADDLKKLQGLPRLQCLVLGLEFIPREEIVIGSEGFRHLLKFSVDCPVPWLNFKEGAMPRLAYLELKVCSGPATPEGVVPSGLGNLQSLSEVFLHYNQKWCSDSSSVKKTVQAVKREVVKHSNPIDLVINGSRCDAENSFCFDIDAENIDDRGDGGDGNKICG